MKGRGLPRAGRALAWASCLALASCAADVLLGVGPSGDGVELCGDGVDNDGDRLVDEGCGAGSPCPRMDARAVGTCDVAFGAAWDGRTCVELSGCACLGARCDSLYRSIDGCEADYASCLAPPDGDELCGDGVDNDGDRLVDEDCPAPCPVDAAVPRAPPEGCGETKVLGYAWDGKGCVALEGCGCEGPACGDLSPDLATCLDAHRLCLPPTCAAPPPDQPAADGSLPPPRPGTTYESYDPATCARIGPLDCGPGREFFSNECGCGCVEPPPPDPGSAFATLLHASYDPTECERRAVRCAVDVPQVSDLRDGKGCGCLYQQDCLAPDEPGVLVVSADPATCATLAFECEGPERVAYRSPCGCGCKPFDPKLCTAAPELYATTDPVACAARPIDCPPDRRPFRDFCGCGCVPADKMVDCPDPNQLGVDYLDATPENWAVCSVLSFQCDADQEPFSEPLCGCGCRPATDPAPVPLPNP